MQGYPDGNGLSQAEGSSFVAVRNRQPLSTFCLPSPPLAFSIPTASRPKIHLDADRRRRSPYQIDEVLQRSVAEQHPLEDKRSAAARPSAVKVPTRSGVSLAQNLPYLS